MIIFRGVTSTLIGNSYEHFKYGNILGCYLIEYGSDIESRKNDINHINNKLKKRVKGDINE